MIVAALVVPLHGLFDVPGHRLAFAWAAAVIMASCLRPAGLPAGSRTRWTWRILGMGLGGSGVWLLSVFWSGEGGTTKARAEALINEVQGRVVEDDRAYQQAVEAGQEYQVNRADGPLVEAFELAKEACQLVPLEPRYHHALGGVAVYREEFDELAKREFAIERRLVPTRIEIPLRQSGFWIGIDQGEIQGLWDEVWLRANREIELGPERRNLRINAFNRMLQLGSGQKELMTKVFALAGNEGDLLKRWMLRAEPAQVDELMPTRLNSVVPEGQREELLALWLKKSPEGPAKDFVIATGSGLEKPD